MLKITVLILKIISLYFIIILKKVEFVQNHITRVLKKARIAFYIEIQDRLTKHNNLVVGDVIHAFKEGCKEIIDIAQDNFKNLKGGWSGHSYSAYLASYISKMQSVVESSCLENENLVFNDTDFESASLSDIASMRSV